VSDCLAEALADDPTKGCPNGTFWVPYPRTQVREACRPCIPGYYCPGLPYGGYGDKPVNLNRPVACPPGTYLDEYGAARLDQCKNCSAGRYQDRVGKSDCVNCPAGTFVSTTGTSALTGCIECFCGHYCLEASVVPTQCPGGTWSPARGNRLRENCVDCPAGSACPNATCDPGGCASCPPGKFSTGAVAGEGWGGGVDVCSLSNDFCELCPASYFCPRASALPTSCPPGTTSQPGATKEADCEDCPVGYRCQKPVNASVLQSSVAREANGELIVGSAVPEECPVDTTVVHFSYPDRTGCVERCPYQLPRQSYCHVAGDGRIPDRGRSALRIGELVVKCSRDSLFTSEHRNEALAELSTLLANMTAEERVSVLTMPDQNGRTPIILAAIIGDMPLVALLWTNGAGAGHRASTMRDAEGFTALMHALRHDNAEVTSWLTIVAQATLAPADVKVLESMGVDVSGVPVAGPYAADEHLGRGGLGWLHPSGAGFADWPEAGPGG